MGLQIEKRASAMKVEPFQVGNSYRTVGGEYVRIVGLHYVNHGYSTVYCAKGVHRYCDRDFGRVTGTPFDFSDPRNLIPLYTLTADDIQAIKDAQQES
jgi:hypothetical protein